MKQRRTEPPKPVAGGAKPAAGARAVAKGQAGVGAGAGTGPAWSIFAIAAPGLEPLVAAELAAMGIEGRAEPGGVSFDGGMREIHDANLRLRSASRIVVRLGEFPSRSFKELERGAGRLAWDRVIAAGAPVRLRVTCRKSRLYHSDAVAERVLRAIAEGIGKAPAVVPPGAEDDTALDEDNESAEAQLILVRVFRDRVTVSADASGALLHRRGYRLDTAKAPLRETLAAAVIMSAGWSSPGDGPPAGPLLDPLCGSGTIPIEAALMARRIAPGKGRRFASLDWPGHDDRLWRDRLAAARSLELPSAKVAIIGSDRDAGAVAASLANAERAGVAGDIEFERRPLSAVAPPESSSPGHLMTNAPYGVRVGELAPLRNLYAQLGNVARQRFAGWTLALLAADPRLVGQLRLPLSELLRTANGGIPVRLMRSLVPPPDAPGP